MVGGGPGGLCEGLGGVLRDLGGACERPGRGWWRLEVPMKGPGGCGGVPTLMESRLWGSPGPDLPFLSPPGPPEPDLGVRPPLPPRWPHW